MKDILDRRNKTRTLFDCAWHGPSENLPTARRVSRGDHQQFSWYVRLMYPTITPLEKIGAQIFASGEYI